MTYTASTGAIAIGQSVGTTDNVSFAGISASATVTADSISVTDVINGQVDDISNHDTDDLTEGTGNLYFTEARTRGALSGGTGVTYTASTGAIAIGQSVGTTDDVTFSKVTADSLIGASDSDLGIRVDGELSMEASAIQMTGTISADSLVLEDGLRVESGRVRFHSSFLELGNSPLYSYRNNPTSLAGFIAHDLSGKAGSFFAGPQHVCTVYDETGFFLIGRAPESQITSGLGSVNAQLDFVMNPDGEVTIANKTTINDSLIVMNRNLLANLDSLEAVLNQLITYVSTVTTDAGYFPCGFQTLTYNGHDYSTVQIGDQCWFAENLRTSKYNDLTDIPDGLTGTEWIDDETGASSVYDEGGASAPANLTNYGRLYNWYAVNTGKLCPTGWKVPSDNDWIALTDALGGMSAAGVAMKATPSDNPGWNGTNSSGFNGLPGGFRNSEDGGFNQIGEIGVWWSTTTASSGAQVRLLNISDAAVSMASQNLHPGVSVRCMRDMSIAN